MMIRSNGWSRRSLLLLSLAATTAISGCAPAPSEDSTRQSSALETSPPPAGSGAPSAKPTPGLPPAFPASGLSGKISPKVGGVPVVPGQLVVKFKSDPRDGITDDVQSCLQRRGSFASITADASSSLDATVRRHGIFRAASLFHGREGLTTSDAKNLLHARAVRT